MNKKGFTLIEILVALSIVAIISVIGMVAYKDVTTKARDSIRRGDLNNIALALEIYFQKYGSYIDVTQGVQGDCSSADTDAFYDSIAPYMSDNVVPKDPLNQSKYCYISVDDGQAYRLFAKLEKCSDSTSTLCSYNYNYSIVSDNITTITPAPNDTLAPTPTPIPTSPPPPTFDATTTAKQNSGTSITFSHTAGALSNGFVIVGLSYRAHNNPGAQSLSVMYAGSAMNYLAGSRVANVDRTTEIWYQTLGNTSLGSKTVTVTMTADPEDLVVGVATYSNVNQSFPVGAAATKSGNSTNPNVDISTEANNTAFGVVAIYTGGANTTTTTSPATQRWKDRSTNIEGASSEISGTLAGSSTLNWTTTQTWTWTVSGVAIKQ